MKRRLQVRLDFNEWPFDQGVAPSFESCATARVRSNAIRKHADRHYLLAFLQSLAVFKNGGYKKVQRRRLDLPVRAGVIPEGAPRR